MRREMIPTHAAAARLLFVPLLLITGCAGGGRAPDPSLDSSAAAVTAGDGSAAAAEHLRRGRQEIEEAQRLRREKSPNPAAGGIFSWPTDAEAYYGHYRRAENEFLTVLEEYRGSPSAPEAQLLLGLINDYPHLSDFDAAIEGYRRTIEEFPGTPAAEEAHRRKSVIERYMGLDGGTPHVAP